MSIETLTQDEFLELTPAEHEEAMELYSVAVEQASQQLPRLDTGSATRADLLDKLCRLLTLRKVHVVRLAEMEEDEQAERPHSVATQYQDNERNPHQVS